MMGGNTLTGGTPEFPNRLEMFDRLPRPIKEVYWRAPHDYNVKEAFDQLARHRGDVAAMRKALIAGIVKSAASICLKTYGTTHPQSHLSGWTPRRQG